MDPTLYKYTKSEILLGPPHFSDQSYATRINGLVQGEHRSTFLSFLLGFVCHLTCKNLRQLSSEVFFWKGGGGVGLVPWV